MITLEQIAAVEAEYTGRIAAAQRAAEERRDAAFVDEVPFDICGIQIRRMTLADFIALSVIGNAHVTRVPLPEDLSRRPAFWALHNAQLLWFLSQESSRDAKARDAFLADIGQFNSEQIEAGIAEYIREMFADAPRGRRAEPGEVIPPDPVGVSFAAHWMATLAKRFPWSRAELRALPLPELFQYLRLIAAEKKLEEGRQVYALDGEVDRLWAEMHARINALNTPSA